MLPELLVEGYGMVMVWLWYGYGMVMFVGTHQCVVEIAGVSFWIWCIHSQGNTVGKDRQKNQILKRRRKWQLKKIHTEGEQNTFT